MIELVIDAERVLALTATLVGQYVSHNAVPQRELPNLIESIAAALRSLALRAKPAAPVSQDWIKKSIGRNHLVCLEDGKKFSTLKRHLAAHHGLTPDEYRRKWGLPGNYPMIAPNYAKVRSDLAKAMDLGKSRTKHPKPKPSRSRAKGTR